MRKKQTQRHECGEKKAENTDMCAAGVLTDGNKGGPLGVQTSPFKTRCLTRAPGGQLNLGFIFLVRANHDDHDLAPKSSQSKRTS